jgi:hypothetical protein
MFANGLEAAGDAVYYELLFVLYKRYPDLRPADKEPPHILSTLRWEKVSLPSSISEADIDQIIFSVLHSHCARRRRSLAGRSIAVGNWDSRSAMRSSLRGSAH